MAFDLSIIIPTEDILVQKDFYSISGGGQAFESDVSMWYSAIYEVWADNERADKIYSDVLKMIIKMEKEVRLRQIEPLVFEKKRELVRTGIRLLSSTGYISTHPEEWMELRSLSFILAKTVEEHCRRVREGK